MRRREFIKGIAGSAAWPLAARARAASKPAKVGYLGPSSPTLEKTQVGALKQRLHELGHVEDKDIVYLFRWAEGHDAHLPALAAELAALKPDVIVTTGTPGHSRPNAQQALFRSFLLRVPIRSARRAGAKARGDERNPDQRR